ncbi:hypothetical protein GCM10007420_23560 [Glycocaulis albus]|jgi:chromosomal replication initiation ATPase DnaA|uniref:Chromosomal replication initiator DnaA C-terminal domain-containing protein n=1 Tax=Glycocaulis albus TaxID=1382801 RepID=A0ABQ1XXL4_9PROT|nr:helix-turn-helix domain-containing protein [Glycocaulis albus]MBV5257495.1 chromosomal replication initiator DnaA [Synechococcus moorigangaii CMS01]GGH06338.1 hypothetical protein GCM10007420_23560 [Glycocaulis albus]
MDIKHARGVQDRDAQDRAREDRARAQLARQAAAFSLGVPVEAVQASGRGTAEAAQARQVAMYLAHVAFEMSLARVALAFGRDRSTVAYACHKIEDMRDDAAFDARLDDLETSLRAMPSPGHPVLAPLSAGSRRGAELCW